ncbi:MAG: UDP-N-acetylglucosamine 2-epimerase (non-hydrolyzing) [Gammaproteobacteria bacterium]|nr:MAG: UDP-N-acetylglucosamine 2-epimerase (non-hydrolyzing) [Gammaproteobacteria bacterium]
MPVMLIFGTRPEAVKMAPVIRALQRHPRLRPVVCLTAQHRSMLDQVMDFFSLSADHDLNLMQPGQSLNTLAGSVLQALAPVFQQERPAAVLVQGDTTSTFCGALAAFHERIPVGHIEAGLRTGDFTAPFPEEMNRVLTTRLARWHFAPTGRNRDNLLAEGVPSERIHVTGNTVIDALLWARERVAPPQGFDRPFVLITGHRRESFGAGFESICRAIAQLADTHPALDFVYPVHLNPQVQEPVRRLLGELPNVRLLEPLAYPEFVALMDRALFILTDSGGVQEEAPSLGKPVLVMRETTERTEGLEGGVRLVGTSVGRIVAESERLLNDPPHYRRMAEAANPYGDGHAAECIVAVLDEALR